MNDKTYCIKSGYQPRIESEPSTSKEEGEPYWNEKRMKSSQYYQYSVYTRAASYIKKAKLKNVLDIGSGSGYKLMKLIFPYCKKVTGIDQPYIVDVCRKRYPAATWSSVDLDMQSTSLGTYDLIICADVIEHLNDPDKLLEFIKANSNQETTIIISTPERDIMSGTDSLTPNNSDHVREWNREEFSRYVKSAGFEVKSVELVHTLCPHLSKHYLYFFRKNYTKLKHTMLVTLKVTN